MLSEDEKIEFALAIGRKMGLEEALDYVECSSKEAAIVRIRQQIKGVVMNTELKERASELARAHEIDGNKYTAKTIRDLRAEVERLRGIEKQAHEEGVIAGKRIAWLEYEIERLEEELKTQKHAAWDHERVSRDYLLAMKKVKNQEEQIIKLEQEKQEARQQAARDAIAKIAKIKVVPQPHNLETAEAYNRGVSAAIGNIKRYFGFKEE